MKPVGPLGAGSITGGDNSNAAETVSTWPPLKVTRALVERIVEEELAKLGAAASGAQYRAAREIFEAVALDDPFVEFLTLPASERIDL